MLNYLETKLLEFNKRFAAPRIYILPTRVGLYFGAVVFILFVISFSYGHSLAYSTSFILVSVMVISLPYTNYNIDKIKVALATQSELFEGDAGGLEIKLANLSHKERYDIEAELIFKRKKKRYETFVAPLTLASLDTQTATADLSSLEMGHYREVLVKIKSTFPFGLFYAWSYHLLESDIWVYAAREESLQGISLFAQGIDHHSQKGEDTLGLQELKKAHEHDDFSHHTLFSVGHSFGSIDWKLFARSGLLYIKEFEGTVPYLLKIEIPRGGHDLAFKAKQISSLLERAWQRGEIFELHAPDFEIHSVAGRGKNFAREFLKKTVIALEKQQGFSHE